MGGFVLLPFRQTILEGDFYKWDDDPLAVIAVIIAHENATSRIACPSQERVAILAGIRKQKVAEAIKSLESGGWLHKVRLPTLGGRTRLEYHMKYARHQKGEPPGKWININDYVIGRGLWATMSPSTRRLYLVLLALSWDGAAVKCVNDNEWEFCRASIKNGRFVDAPRLAPADLRRMAGIEPRTFTRVWNWLNENGVVLPAENSPVKTEEFYREGVALPYAPEMCVPKIIERLEKYKAKIDTATPGARRLIKRSSTIKRHHAQNERT